MKCLAWLLLLLALLLPGLAVVPHSQHVFWLPESATWLMLWPAAALAAWWAHRSEDSVALPGPLKRSFAALWACWALSAALALRVDISALALAEWSGYALIFFAVWRWAGDAKRRGALLALLMAYGLLNSAYALLQATGLDNIDWSIKFAGRAGGFLGNPNFLGGHLALLFPVSLALALDRRQSGRGFWRNVGPWLLALALGGGLLLTQTRGAWLGAGVGVGLVLALAGRHMGPLLSRNRKPLLTLGLLGLSVVAVYFVQRPQLWTRIAETFSGEDVELGRRAFLMKKASQLASLHPLLGTGPGNFRLEFTRVQVQGLDPKAYNTQPYVVTEHAHNDFLQMAAETGVPAALLWALLMLLVLRALYQAVSKTGAVRDPAQGGLLALGVLGGLVALLLHGLANFPFLIVPTQAAAWALAALALRAQAKMALPAALDGLVDEHASTPMPAAGQASRRVSPLAAKVALTLGLLAVAASVVYNYRRLAQDRLWWIGQGELQLNNHDKASIWLLRALAYNRREDRLWVLHGRAETDRQMIWNGIGSFREALRLAPYDAEAAVRLGRNLVENKEYVEAEKVLRQASDYAPNFYDLWEPLAAALFFQGKFDEAVLAYDWMIYFNVNGENAYVNKAAAQGSAKKLPQALLTLKQAEERFPDKPKIFVNQAVTYVKLGMPNEARLAVKKAEALGGQDPQLDQIKRMLR